MRTQPVKAETKEIRVADAKAIDRARSQAARDTAARFEKNITALQNVVKRQSKTLSDIAMLAAKAANIELPKIELPNVAVTSSVFTANQARTDRIAQTEIKAALGGVKLPLRTSASREASCSRAEVRHDEGSGRQRSRARGDRRRRVSPAGAGAAGDILRGLAELEAIGKADVSFALAGVAAGKSAASSTFERYRSRLQSAGLVRYPKAGRLTLTNEGRKIAPASESPLSSDDIQNRCLALLTPYQQDLVRALLRVHPTVMSREQLGEAAGKQSSSSTFERYVSSLRSMEIVEYPSKNSVKAADWLFLE